MGRRLPVFLRTQEIEPFLAAVADPRLRLLASLMLFCGLRVSEACQLRIEHIDLDGTSLLVSRDE